jgi:hypothetical protein
MSLELFLQAVFHVSVAVAFTGLCVALVAVALCYFYQMAASLIKNRVKHIDKIKKARVWDAAKKQPILISRSKTIAKKG